MKTLFKHIGLYALLLNSSLIIAQVNFEATLSKNKLGLNERLRIDFVMNKNGDNFTPPNFENFQIIGGPNQSIKTSYLNGEQNFIKKTFSYFLKPLKKGKLIIYQATVTIDGQEYKSLPVEVNVTNSVKGANSNSDEEYFDDDNIELIASVSKSSPYINEPITIVYKLYYKSPINVSNASESEAPKYKDFFTQNIKIPQLKVDRETYKGQIYNVVDWKKVVLYPQRDGNLEISPLSLNLVLDFPTNKRDFFGNIIRDQASKIITTGSKIITVRKLPDNGKPKNFSGAVGQFEFDIILNKNSLKASESFQAKVKVTGQGNLKLFDLPNLMVPASMELYEPERKENVKTNLSGMSGTIENIYTIVPKFQGKFPIQELEFSYFDPLEKTYKTVKSQKLNIDVFEGPTLSSNNNENIVLPVSESFKFIKKENNFTIINKEQFSNTSTFYILLSIPVLSLLSFIIFYSLPKRRELNNYEKIKKVYKQIKINLNNAEKSIGNKDKFYDLVEKAIYNCLKARFSIETNKLNKESIKKQMILDGISIDKIEIILKLVESCERARYSNSSDYEMTNDLNIARKIFDEILKK
ncbi:MAG TPA: BatD family protein [Flavobacteriaceae bacterium]|nr:BatD family protein [Flavobacteriaceae bacterium]